MKHDKKNKLYSVPACFEEKFSLRFIPVLHLMAFLCWLMASRTNVTGELYLWGLLGVAIVLVYEHYLIYMQGKSAVGKAFFPLNSVVSCLFLLVCCLQIFVSFPAL
jgi:4-hydroxybenzoate polyprenyltransferase